MYKITVYFKRKFYITLFGTVLVEAIQDVTKKARNPLRG